MRVLWRQRRRGLELKRAGRCEGCRAASRPVLLLAMWLVTVAVDPLARPAPEERVRPAAVAGSFYPEDATRLRGAIDAFLAHAEPRGSGTPLALVVPHAGYVFSGQIAADAFAQVAGRTYDAVIVLGTNHTAPGFARVALYEGSGFRTPLGVARIDEALGRALMEADPDVVLNDDVHASEHSIEVQLPFVQRLWPDARVLPLVVGAPDPRLCERLGRALASVMKDRRVLLVASTDLSHYAAAAAATRSDRALLGAVETLQPATIQQVARRALEQGVPGLVTAACGEAPLLAAVHAARALGANGAFVASHATSADSPLGDPGRTVGYGAVVLGIDVAPGGVIEAPAASGSNDALTTADGAMLLAFARDTIRQYLETGTVPLARSRSPRLQRAQGAFVTLRKHGILRGCVGRVVSDAPLLWTIGVTGLGAAFRDPRFPPLSPAELPAIEIEISALGTPRRIGQPAQIRIGRDGVVLEKGGRTGVFLPEVAVEEGWAQEELLDRLCEKAQFPADCWRNNARLSVFQTQTFRETRAR